MLLLIQRLSPSRVANHRQTFLGAVRIRIERVTCGIDAFNELVLTHYHTVIYYHIVMRLEFQCEYAITYGWTAIAEISIFISRGR